MNRDFEKSVFLLYNNQCFKKCVQVKIENYVFDDNPIGGPAPSVQKVCFC